MLEDGREAGEGGCENPGLLGFIISCLEIRASLDSRVFFTEGEIFY